MAERLPNKNEANWANVLGAGDGAGGFLRVALNDDGTLKNPGLPSWFQSGAGPPVGFVTPSQIGALYQDTTNGSLWEAVGATNVDWFALGGNTTGTGGIGVFSNGTTTLAIVALNAGDAQILLDSAASTVTILTGSLIVQSGNGSKTLIATDGSGQGIAFYDGTTPVAQAAVTGALSTVVDPAVKAVLTSIIAALSDVAGVGLFTDGTT